MIRFHKASKLISPEEHYLGLLQLCMSRRNENKLKQDNKSYEGRYEEVKGDILCNIKRHEPYLDNSYEVLKILKLFIQMMKKIMLNFQ